MRKYDVAIFDFDGTVFNTLGDIVGAVNFALTECNFPTRTEAEIKSYLGEGADVLMKKAVPANTPDNVVSKALETYKSYYMEHSSGNSVIYDGMTELISILKYEGIVSGIVSNKPESILEKLCEEYLHGVFGYIAGESPKVAKKPAPDSILNAMDFLSVSDKSKAIYIGDSVVDAMAAKNAGIDFIGVAWGYTARAELEKAGVEHIADTPSQILDIITYKNQ